MTAFRRLSLSIVFGVLITALLTFAAVVVDNRPASQVLLWQGTLLRKLMGPPPLLGHDEDGNPIYEGTPIDVFVALVGVLMGIPIYGLLSFLVLRWTEHRRKSELR